ncbi:MAG: metallophosphoesterase, partial [Cyanobacteria bacterium P01_D01_bin.73]
MSNRRQFLTRFIAGSLGVTGLGSLFLSGEDTPSIAQSSPKQPGGQLNKTGQKLEPPPMQIATLSDLNGPYGSTIYRKEVHQAIKRILDGSPALVLCAGDMVAGQKRGLTR